MAAGPSGKATPSDVRTLGEKLEEFGRTLSPGEQAVLSWLVQQAAMAAPDETLAQGYAIVLKPRENAPSGSLPFEFEATWALDDHA